MNISARYGYGSAWYTCLYEMYCASVRCSHRRARDEVSSSQKFEVDPPIIFTFVFSFE